MQIPDRVLPFPGRPMQAESREDMDPKLEAKLRAGMDVIADALGSRAMVSVPANLLRVVEQRLRELADPYTADKVRVYLPIDKPENDGSAA